MKAPFDGLGALQYCKKNSCRLEMLYYVAELVTVVLDFSVDSGLDSNSTVRSVLLVDNVAVHAKLASSLIPHSMHAAFFQDTFLAAFSQLL
jgi:hypothetical protein